MEGMKEITDSNYRKFIRNGKSPKAIKVGADWCKPCKYLEKKMPEIMKAVSHIEWGFLDVTDINSPKCRNMVEKYKINTVPQILVFKGGRKVLEIIGFTTISQLINQLKKIEA